MLQMLSMHTGNINPALNQVQTEFQVEMHILVRGASDYITHDPVAQHAGT
jgi:hypothetical protein